MMARVLVVEDELTLRELIAETLRDEGYAVDTAANGAEALERMREVIPNAIVLDLMMPVMGGETFARECQKVDGCQAVPMVVVSAAHGLARAAEELRPFGVRATLAKPFDLDVVAAVVAQLVSGSVPGSSPEAAGA